MHRLHYSTTKVIINAKKAQQVPALVRTGGPVVSMRILDYCRIERINEVLIDVLLRIIMELLNHVHEDGRACLF